MLKFVQRYFAIHEAAGLDIHIAQDGQWITSGFHVKFVGGRLQVIATYADMHDMKERMPVNVPLVVTINGKGILMRLTTSENANIIGQLFPGANPGEFFLSNYHVNEEETYTFLCRKSLTGQVLELLDREGLRPVYAAVGLESFSRVLPFLENDDVEISTSSYHVCIKEQKIVVMNYNVQADDPGKGTVGVGGVFIRGTHVLLMGAVLEVMLKTPGKLGGLITNEFIDENRERYKYYRLFNFSFWSVLTVILVLLVANFITFSYYFGENEKAKRQTGTFKENIESVTAQKEAVDSAYNFFVEAGWNTTTRHGYYVDRIAALAPETVQFLMLQSSCPQETAEQEGFLFRPDMIRLSGSSSDPTDLETFSRAIRNIEGVLSVTIDNYQYKRELSAAIFLMEIKVKI